MFQKRDWSFQNIICAAVESPDPKRVISGFRPLDTYSYLLDHNIISVRPFLNFMPKLFGPAMSLDAKGSLGKTVTFQKRPSGHTIYPYKKPGDREPFESSPKQKDQRGIIGLLTAHWQCMTEVQRTAWNDLATSLKLQISGYHYWLRTAQKNLLQYHGLAGYWSFNRMVGAYTPDLSGNGNDGLFSPSYPSNCPVLIDSINKKFGKAGQFDGIDNYVNCGNDASLNSTDAITIEAWGKWQE